MNRSKQLGTAAESEVVRYLQERGWPHVERRALAGSADRGDIAGVEFFTIEVKNCAKIELGPWLNEAHTEATNARTPYGVVWAKRRGKGKAGDWFVVMDGHTFADLLEQAYR